MGLDPHTDGTPEWTTGLDDPIHRAPIVGYLRAIRAHWLLCLFIVLAALAGSAASIVTSSQGYVAKGSLLVNPVPEIDTTLAGLPVIRASGSDPERPVKTAATLMRSSAVTDRASELIDGELTPQQIEIGVEVTAEEGENLISVEATNGDPQLAARLANAYIDATLDVRRETLRPLVAAAIRNTRSELDGLPATDSPQGIELQLRLSELRTIADGRDPTLSVAQRASPPSSPEGEPAWLILALALAAGAVIAAAISILVELLVPGPIRDESELQALIPAPIIARLPRLGGRRALSMLGDSPSTALEGFRMLRGQLQHRSHARATEANGGPLLRGVIAITSASAGDGRTSVAVGLAGAVAATNSDALLIETDVRHPSLATELEIEPDDDLTSLLDLNEDGPGIVTPLPRRPGVGVVVARRVEQMRALEQLNADIPKILERARRLADCVIVDAPPLALASDALPTLSAVDQVILVVRLGHTRRAALLAAAEVLAQRGLTLAGIVVIGSPLLEEIEAPHVSRESAAPVRSAR